ncbi:hypothetical protein [Paenibacillus campi]|uniref:hypothetical protein n=1 Tax=Paenibacillus campi TaxID=3106031 RepID=UPI002AFFA723|nr:MULTISPECIES: hypothetical protein [unclassified Paenibacillus]
MKKLPLLFSLVFFIPAIVLSFAIWSEFSKIYDPSAVGNGISDVTQVWYADDGTKVLTVLDGSSNDGMTVAIYNGDGTRYYGDANLDSDTFRNTVVAYQQGKTIITVKDMQDHILAYQFNPDSDATYSNIVNKPVLSSGFLSSSTVNWRGRILIASDDTDSADSSSPPFIATIHDAKFHYVSLERLAGLEGKRIKQLRQASSTFDTTGATVPMYEATLADDTTGYISAILQANGTPAVYYKPNSDQTSFDVEDAAQLYFQKQFGRSGRATIAVDSNYPKQAYVQSANGQTQKVLPLPKPLYAAHLFLLNDDEILVAGSTAKDPAQGKAIAYVYNEVSGQSTDVSALVRNLTMDDLQNPNLKFYKESGSAAVYYSDLNHSAGWLNTETGQSKQLTTADAKSWQLNGHTGATNSQTPTLRGFWEYIRQGGPLVINWVLWLFIPFLTLATPFIIFTIASRAHKRALKRGIVYDAIILRMKETGTRINEQPLVRFTLQFQHEGQQREVDVTKVVSYLNAPSVGDTVMISYDPKRHKAVFLTEQDDIPANHTANGGAEPEIIQQATLQRIERHATIGRADVLILHVEADGQLHRIPVVQAPHFTYEPYSPLTLIRVGSIVRLYRYGSSVSSTNDQDQITLDASLVNYERMNVHAADRALVLMNVSIHAGDRNVPRVNSLFVPDETLNSMRNGMRIPVSVNRHEFARELRLLKGKQGSMVVQRVSYNGTIGERPLASIIAERDGQQYRIEQSIEPLYGVKPGDELWVSYDEQTREATIVQYAST